MNWYQNLYIGKKVRQNKTLLQQQIEQGDYPEGMWMITVASGDCDLFDVRPVSDFKHDYLKQSCRMIIGLASGKKEALELVENIVQSIYSETGTIERDYFLKNRN